MTQNSALVFTDVPQRCPIAGQHFRVCEQDPFDLNALPPPGGLTGQVLYASLDPYLRHRMVSMDKARDGFVPLEIGTVIPNSVILRVLKSHAPEFQIGDMLLGMAPIQEYVTLSVEDVQQLNKIENPFNVDLKYFLGPLGMPGLTAYAALYGIGNPVKGETIFVSAATGAVGQLVGQLAKREGLKVIGSVGSDEKQKILTGALGFDGAFNYHAGEVGEHLEQLAPGGIDIYYDNVGGPQLDAALVSLKRGGRIVACGYASQYSIPPGEQYGLKNTSQVIAKGLIWRGFNVFDNALVEPYRVPHQENVGKWIADKSIHVVMSQSQGISEAADGLAQLLEGRNKGKSIVDFGVAI